MSDLNGTAGPQHSFRSLVHGAWRATQGVRPRFFACILCFIFAYGIDLLGPWAIGYTLGVFVREGLNDASLMQGLLGIGAYIAIRLVHAVLHHLGRYLQLTAAYSARMETIQSLLAKILAFPLSWQVHHHSGENLSRLHRATGAIDATVGNYVWQIVDGLTKVIFVSGAIFALDFRVALNVSLMALATILIMIGFNKRLVRSIRENNAFLDRLNRTVVDHLMNVITIKSLDLEDNSARYLKGQVPQGAIFNERIARFGEIKWGVVGIGYTLVIGTSLVIYFIGHLNASEPFDVAQVYVLLNYLDRIFAAIGSFTGYYSGLIEAATAYEDATRIEKEYSLLRSKQAPTGLPENWKSLEVRNLTFTYSSESGEALRDCQFTIQAGDKIAIVGPSGAGKSTILKLMGGLLTPEQVSVFIDGARHPNFDSVAESTLIVPQEPEIFSDTMRYNLTLGDDFAATEIAFFAQLCRLDNVVEKLPQGWDSSLAESGMNISVGEKQRVALARGLLRARRKHILLFDEPTSSLDPTTEKQIFLGLLHHFSERVVITACHRLTLVPLFNKVMFVRRGRIEECGTFEELLAHRGAFFQTWQDYEERLVRSGEGQR